MLKLVMGLLVVASGSHGQKRLIFTSDDEFRQGNFISAAAKTTEGSSTSNQDRISSFDYNDDPLPSGPTPRSRTPFFDYEDDPLPAGPTREAPLPSGPTRRPGQATPSGQPDKPKVGVPRDVFNALILLTTERPATVTPRANVNFGLNPPRGHRGRDPLFSLPHSDGGRRRGPGGGRRGPGGGRRGPGGGLLISADLDIIDQTALFTNMDPNQEQFIKTPTLNAGALPLAFESSVPLNRFPPFNKKP